MYDLVIKNGTIVTGKETVQADIAVDKESIAAIGHGLAGQEEIDASGGLIFPGIIDAHTHMALPVSGTRSSDDFFTGTLAAACGGVTTIVDFTVGTSETTIPTDIEARKRTARPAVIDYGFHAEVIGWQPGQEGQFEEALGLGVNTFKFYAAYAASGRRSDNGVLYHAFGALADLDGVALIHCEDEAIIDSILRQLDEKELGRMANLAVSRPPICEASAITQVAYLAQQTGVRAHIVHVSSGLGLAAVRGAKNQGIRITAETCPQYLLLDSALYDKKNGHLFSASPALRTKQDQAQLWQGLADGTLDLVATDHCPFTREQKTWNGSFLDLPYGLPGVETLLPIMYSEGVVKGRIPLTAIPRLLCEGPARINGLYPRKGTLSAGASADIVLFDPKKEWTLSPERLHMNTDFSPYAGLKVRGKVATTILRGRVIYTDEEFKGTEGWGRFISSNKDGETDC
jgi:dihydropyrimidinase